MSWGRQGAEAQGDANLGYRFLAKKQDCKTNNQAQVLKRNELQMSQKRESIVLICSGYWADAAVLLW